MCKAVLDPTMRGEWLSGRQAIWDAAGLEETVSRDGSEDENVEHEDYEDYEDDDENVEHEDYEDYEDYMED
jgi:hypothetical protein